MTLARSDVSREASWTPPRHATPDARPETLDACATDTAHDAWSTYWNTLPFRAELCRLEAEDFVARLATVVALQAKWRVLDFGCGFGTITMLLARAVGEVCAWDPSPSMRAWAQRNAVDRANVQIVERSSDRRLVGDAEPYDLIVVNSVIQYMSARERRLWLCRWRDLLAPGGRIVLSDLVSPRHHVWDDAVSLCRFYAQHGRLTDALRQRLRDLGLYSRARRMCRLSSVGREELRRDAAAAGLAMQLLATNLTYRTHRTAALLSAD